MKLDLSREPTPRRALINETVSPDISAKLKATGKFLKKIAYVKIGAVILLGRNSQRQKNAMIVAKFT